MRKTPFIANLRAAALLIVCLVSLLPKSYFHDAVAAHTDAASCTHPEKQTDCVHAEGFQCGFTDLVVASPYTPATVAVDITGPAERVVFNTHFPTVFLPNAFLSADGRGPPSAA